MCRLSSLVGAKIGKPWFICTKRLQRGAGAADGGAPWTKVGERPKLDGKDGDSERLLRLRAAAAVQLRPGDEADLVLADRPGRRGWPFSSQFSMEEHSAGGGK